MSDEKTSFATHLTHKFDLVDAQVQSGLYVIKRTSAFLKKIVTAQGECAIALDKATKNEQTKLSTKGSASAKTGSLQRDGMGSHVTAVCSLQDVFNGVINKYREFGAKVTSDVIAPLLEFLKTGEKRRKDIVAKEMKHTKNLRAQYDKLKKLRATAQASWNTVQQTNKEITTLGDAKGAKLQPKLKKALEQGKKDFQAYEKCTVETHQMAQEYFNSLIPELLKQLEELERDRLQLLKAQLALFAKLYNIWDSPTSPGNSYGDTVALLDAKTDMHKCIVARVTEVGMPSGPPELPPPLPCKSGDLDSEAWRTPVAPEPMLFDQGPPRGDVKFVPTSAPTTTTTTTTHASSTETDAEDGKEPEATTTEEPESHTASSTTTTTAKSSGEEPASEGEASSEGPVQFARAVFEYQTDHADDLQFKVGDIIRLITSEKVDFSKHDPNNPVWLLGELRDTPDKTGSFPSNYVEEFKP